MRTSTGWAPALAVLGMAALGMAVLDMAACGYSSLPRLGDAAVTDAGVDSGTNMGADGRTDGSVDGGADSGIDANACFGTGIVRVCLSAPPSVPLMFSTPRTIDTDDPSMCDQVVSGGSGLCVLSGTSITISAVLLRAHGKKPLVFVASDSITETSGGVIDVGSHRGQTFEIGAGADPMSCGPGSAPSGDGSTSGGGAGGSFGSSGGNGGSSGGGRPGGLSEGSLTTLELRGGCAGQSGAGGATRAAGGHGGGAVYFIAGTRIDVAGAVTATGEGGLGGPSGTPTNGGGGGGSGGMIGFDAPVITATGLILASGGGGGEGSAPPVSGANGADPIGTAAAIGGNGMVMPGGDGGSGSPASGGAANVGQNATSSSGASGGGGGGGAGVIQAPAGANLGTNISPPPTH